ncbi:MAG: ATP-dependent sacrificial sulfur transferase LarE [Polyangiaceae bacterium]
MTATEPTPTFDAKMDALVRILRDMGSVLVCYSGGVDSAFVLAVAHRELGPRAVGMTAVSPSLAPYEKDAAIDVARQIGADHRLVESHEIDDVNYQANGADRCFHCKSELYRIAADRLRAWDLAVAVNGVNTDDLGDYRPGLEAAKRAKVRSPLVEAGFTKEDVRQGASAIGLTVWNKPASACLSSRLPYGTKVTRERLQRIGALELDLKDMGLRQVRVRWHALGDATGNVTGNATANTTADAPSDKALARVEVAGPELERAFTLRDRIVAAGKRHGFAYVTLDLQGYRTGSHNELLDGRSLRVL